jgi:endonuclease/exonuclease/phosphatase family metal-dependent hydrolase
MHEFADEATERDDNDARTTDGLTGSQGTTAVGFQLIPDRQVDDDSDDGCKVRGGAKGAGKVSGGRGEPFQIRTLTINCTTTVALKPFLRETQANVVFVQEHHMRGDGLLQLAETLRGWGWTGVWAQAAGGATESHSSGGVAVLAKAPVVATALEGLQVKEHGGRLVAAMLIAPQARPFTGYSVYLHDSVGMSPANRAIMHEWGEHAVGLGRPYILGGDFNNRPVVVQKEIDQMCMQDLGAHIVCVENSVGTCVVDEGKATNIDYMVMDDRLIQAVQKVEVDVGGGFKPHRPVSVSFLPYLSSLKVRRMQGAGKLPREAPFGPRPRPREWGPLTQGLKNKNADADQTRRDPGCPGQGCAG